MAFVTVAFADLTVVRNDSHMGLDAVRALSRFPPVITYGGCRWRLHRKPANRAVVDPSSQ
jgi:hypothetical protein